MHKVRVYSMVIVLLACVAWLSSCTKEAPQQPAQPAASPAPQPAQQAAPPTPAQAPPPAPASQAAQPSPAGEASAPAAAPSSAKVAGAPTAEKYRLYISNYARTALTVSVNSEWVGQWDSHTDVPLESVVQGKNELKVELQDQPKKELKVAVYTKRGGQDVYILSLDFNGKTGTYTYAFVAK